VTLVSIILTLLFAGYLMTLYQMHRLRRQWYSLRYSPGICPVGL